MEHPLAAIHRILFGVVKSLQLYRSKISESTDA